MPEAVITEDTLNHSGSGLCEARRKWRRPLGLRRSFLPYGFDGVISCAGGYVECGGQVLFDCPMTPGQLETALDVFHDNGVFCTIEARDQNFGDTGLADAYAFGDSRNDWEMLKTVGFGVAMGNADPALKAQADYVCPPVTEDGLAQAFQALGLSENFG